jgi:chitosanase
VLTPLQARTAKAIVDVFETGFVRGDYAAVTLVPGDSGGLTYGRAQATLASGGLGAIVARYAATPGARFAALLAPHLAKLEARDRVLDHDLVFANALRVAADDPAMRDAQDAFFDEAYWEPALRAAARLGLGEALSIAIVYDGFVHGSFATLARRTTERRGDLDALGERGWIREYVALRRDWLAAHRRRDLRATVYRMDAFRALADHALWALPLPLVVRGREIDAATIEALPSTVFEGPAPGSREISLRRPLARGHDVRRAQEALCRAGHPLVADGLFGPISRDAVTELQALHGLAVTGTVEAATFTALGLRG